MKCHIMLLPKLSLLKEIFLKKIQLRTLDYASFFCINLLQNYFSDYPCFCFVLCLFLSTVINVFPIHATSS